MIKVLRIGHRIKRDKRITTHVALAARAFGADKIAVDTKDQHLEENIRSICRRFGGDFIIETGLDYKKEINKWDGVIVHLTMYGKKLDESIERIDKNQDLLVIIGSEKVPREIYDLADFNISVSNQPHSEVSALALFLDRYSSGRWIDKRFKGKIEILPSNKGKKVLSKEDLM